MVSMETEHLEFRAQVWRYWKGTSVAVSLTPENYCNWQVWEVWEVWEVWIRPSRPLHVFLMVCLTKMLTGWMIQMWTRRMQDWAGVGHGSMIILDFLGTHCL